jgi:hypothetical protein
VTGATAKCGVDIPEGFYTLELASTNPLQFTGLYATDNGIGKQILLKPPQDVTVIPNDQMWFVSPVSDEPNTYLITKSRVMPGVRGFMPLRVDRDLPIVVLENPERWVFYASESPILKPHVYFIQPSNQLIGVKDLLGPGPKGKGDKEGVVIDVYVVGSIPDELPVWQLQRVLID